MSQITEEEDSASGFEPTWESLTRYQVPAWFGQAKFGIWAHWGPQCQPEEGDWYAREMYIEGQPDYARHLEKYGHPSVAGFKDVIHSWKAENWDPDELVSLYKKAGAQYFVALANHHDNFDLWDSEYQPWNSTVVGPKKDIVGGWEKAARSQGLKFGVSVHASHTWTWYESSQGSDLIGPYAGNPYDGKLGKEQGSGQWWEGLDPQDLYEQRHTPSPAKLERYSIMKYWDWGNGCNPPDSDYCQKFKNRTRDLIDKHKPDLIYFDDDVLPLWPISQVGLEIASYYYNSSMYWNEGVNQAVINGKALDDTQKKAMVWDIERGHSDKIEASPWQTDTCLGDWHYSRRIYRENGYKSAKTVIQTLIDVVSKNGNLLLSVPLRGDGTLDEKEREILEEISEWMEIHSDCIFATVPFHVSGEGPASNTARELEHQGFNEGTGKPYCWQDVRFTCKDDTLFVAALGMPEGTLGIESLGMSRHLEGRSIHSINLVGSDEEVQWNLTDSSLDIEAPRNGGNQIATIFRLQLI